MVQGVRAAWSGIVTSRELQAWLGTITCTRPFTVEDCAALQALLKAGRPDPVEVFVLDGAGKLLHVRVGDAFATKEITCET